jgi:hypothetical protein
MDRFRKPYLPANFYSWVLILFSLYDGYIPFILGGPAAAPNRPELVRYLEQILQSHWQHGFSEGYLLVRPPPTLFE